MKSWKLASLVILVLAGPLQGQSTLQFKFKQGDKFAYTIDQKMKVSASRDGKEITVAMTQNMEMAWEILKVADKGAAQARIKFGRTKMTRDFPMGKIAVDSQDAQVPEGKDAALMHQVVTVLAGMELTCTVEPSGAMKDLKFPDQVKGNIKKISGVGMGDLFTEEGLRRMVQGDILFPMGEIAKGKTWTQKTHQRIPFGKMAGDLLFTYDGPVEKDGQKLEKITIKPNITLETNPNSKFQAKVKGQKGESTILFDNAAGRIFEVNAGLTMEMAVDPGNGNVVNQTMVQNSTIRLKK